MSIGPDSSERFLPFTGGLSIEQLLKVQPPSHGERYEHRERTNGQPNGYRAISEAELQELKTR